MPTANAKIGELRIKPVDGTKFLGYGPKFDGQLDWIDTGDIVSIDANGSVELITSKEDLIVDKNGKIIEHWTMEKTICAYDQVKGAQIISASKNDSLTAVLVLKTASCDQGIVKSDIQSLCKNNQVSL
ncbi:unnamed protein product [Anisakis simplex]|uniref:DUF3237 family protein n=1 Tax=Anisakis simplex TaxID=6269 RepID=A0A0M3J242_ANISI|nr:unnamed protein product [Anisakis simplex]